MGISRSENMARIRPSDTKPEIILRRALWADGLRYRTQYKIEKIRPDIVFVKTKLAIFVDGCQWHGCPEHYVRPRTKNEFWGKKLFENVKRDTMQTQLLTSKGWTVFRVWEHDVWENLSEIIAVIKTIIQGKKVPSEINWRVFKVDIIDLEYDIEKRYMLNLWSPETIKYVEKQRSTKKWKRR